LLDTHAPGLAFDVGDPRLHHAKALRKLRLRHLAGLAQRLQELPELAVEL
jgi:hypothetical protein